MELELIRLTKKFPGFTLGPLDLKVKDEVSVMVGLTGSGKTTVLNLISGIITPDNESVILDGSEITHQTIESRRVGYSFQILFCFLILMFTITLPSDSKKMISKLKRSM